MGSDEGQDWTLQTQFISSIQLCKHKIQGNGEGESKGNGTQMREEGNERTRTLPSEEAKRVDGSRERRDLQ